MKKEQKKEPQLLGMISYELIGDGCLNGSWTNNYARAGEVMNEIARKTDAGNRNDIPGNYQVSWIQPDEDEPVIGRLRITENGTLLYLEWVVEGDIYFRGVGMRIGERQIVVAYWDEETILLEIGTHPPE